MKGRAAIIYCKLGTMGDIIYVNKNENNVFVRKLGKEIDIDEYLQNRCKLYNKYNLPKIIKINRVKNEVAEEIVYETFFISSVEFLKYNQIYKCITEKKADSTIKNYVSDELKKFVRTCIPGITAIENVVSEDNLYPSHGDLSDKNILVRKRKIIIVDIDGYSFGYRPFWFDLLYYILSVENLNIRKKLIASFLSDIETNIHDTRVLIAVFSFYNSIAYSSGRSTLCYRLDPHYEYLRNTILFGVE